MFVDLVFDPLHIDIDAHRVFWGMESFISFALDTAVFASTRRVDADCNCALTGKARNSCHFAWLVDHHWCSRVALEKMWSTKSTRRIVRIHYSCVVSN